MTLAVTGYAGIKAVESGSADLGTPNVTHDTGAKSFDWVSGTGEYQADLIWSDRITLAASATQNLDLAGSLTGLLGGTLTFAKVKAIYVKADAANTNNVNVGGAASNGFVGPFLDATDKVAVRPGGVFLVTAPETGWTVTAAWAAARKGETGLSASVGWNEGRT
jgi:hypothetical protein